MSGWKDSIIYCLSPADAGAAATKSGQDDGAPCGSQERSSGPATPRVVVTAGAEVSLGVSAAGVIDDLGAQTEAVNNQDGETGQIQEERISVLAKKHENKLTEEQGEDCEMQMGEEHTDEVGEVQVGDMNEGQAVRGRQSSLKRRLIGNGRQKTWGQNKYCQEISLEANSIKKLNTNIQQTFSHPFIPQIYFSLPPTPHTVHKSSL